MFDSRPAHTLSLIAALLLLSLPARSASLYVTSDAVEDPMATNCTLGAPCHIDDAIRIAETNSADDTLILVGPSTFIGSRYVGYYPNASDLDRDFGIEVDGGAGLFDGNGKPLSISLHSRNGNLSVSGIEIRNSSEGYDDTSQNDPLKITSTGGDITVHDVTLWNNVRTVFNGQHDGTAGARLETDSGNVTVTDSLSLYNKPGAFRIDANHASMSGNSLLASDSDSNASVQGAVRIRARTVDIENNDFSGNKCAGAGFAGALSVDLENSAGSAPVDSRIVNNRFINNEGHGCSGAIHLERGILTTTGFISWITIDRNLFKANRAYDAPGGAIDTSLDRQSRLRMRNNLMFDNQTVNLSNSGSLDGSALYASLLNDAELHLVNNTIVENPLAQSSGSSGAVHIKTYSYQNRVDVYNNILWDNPTTVGAQDDSDLFMTGDSNASVTVRYNKFGARSVYAGSNSNTVTESDNVFSAPGFYDAANEDYHLDSGSLLIDAGYASASQLPSDDMDGQARIQSTTVDIGADEFSGVPRRLVSIMKAGSGFGSVSSVPSGLSCGSGCGSSSALFDDGTTIGLLAVPDTDSVFVGWGGDCSGTSTGTQFTVNSPLSCTAEFKPRRHRIVINAQGPESGSIGSDFGPALNWFYPVGGTQRTVEDIPPGTDVVITGTISNPTTGHVFLDDCEAQGGVVGNQASSEATCTFSNIQQDHTMTVSFNSGIVLFPGRTLTVTKTGLGDGTVTSTPPGIDCGATCSHDFFFNTDVTLTAAPDAQSLFVSWGGDCPTGSNSVVITMDAAKNCTAEFIAANSVTIAFGGNGSGNFNDVYRATGTQYPQWSSQYSARYPDSAGLQFQANGNDSTVTIQGCDDAGQGMSLTGNGTGNASCSIGSLTQNVNLSVTYTANQSTLTVNASGNGSGTVSTDQGGIAYSYPAAASAQSSPIAHGNNVVISATGGNGSTVHWSGCTGPGASISGEGSSASSCRIGIYQATSVDVEFRSSTSPSTLFNDGFE